MRASVHSALVAASAFLLALPPNAGGQCSPSIQKLATDQRFDAARGEADALIKKNGSDDAALHCMGWIYMEMDKSGDATEWFEKAIQVNDKDAFHHLWLANALGDQAQHANKLKLPFLARRIKGEFDRAAQLDPTSIDARHGLIQFYSQAPGVMGGSMDKAKDEAREITKLNAMRGHIEMAALLGNKDKDMVGAERELKAAVAAASPDSAAALYSLGLFYQNQKRWPEAFALYEQMMKDKPGEVLAHFQYGRAAAASGDNSQRGVQELEYWLANAPKDAPVVTRSGAHYRLGTIYEKEGKKDAARSEYQTALQLNAKNGDAKKALDALR